MATTWPENPFPVSGYQGSEYFCDREEETARMLSNMINGNSTSLIALRRIGKTGLINHVLTKLPRGWKGIYIDILQTEDLSHFLNLFATSLINSVPEKSSLGKKFWDFIKSLRPLISFDNLTGYPKASFDIKPKEVETNLSSILQFIDNQDYKILIAIDEFQQILNFPEKTTDAWLRSQIQQLKNVVFIFSGSQQHLMNEIFTSPKRPFFRSTQIMKIDKINSEVYCRFIVSMFEKGGKRIEVQDVTDILTWCNTHTFYVQQVCNRIYATTLEKSLPGSWKQQASLLLKEQESVFFAYRNMLTNPQWQLMKAIAEENSVYQPTSKAFISKHNLGSSATIIRSLKSLQNSELIYQDYDSEGNQYYSVYDVFFQRWAGKA